MKNRSAHRYVPSCLAPLERDAMETGAVSLGKVENDQVSVRPSL